VEIMRYKMDNNKWFNTNIKIISDTPVDKEIKLFCILDLLHNEAISIHKAHELCTEVGLFSDEWVVIDAKVSEVWEKYWEEDQNVKENKN
jgi:hypothetical protein